MQRLINNWSTTLQAPLLAADLEVSVPPALAARVQARLQGEGDFCDITVDPEGASPEIVRVTGTGTGTLLLGGRALEGTITPASWPAGTVLRCTVTAGLLERLQSGGGGGLADAPQDGELYGRADGAWAQVPAVDYYGLLSAPGNWWTWSAAPGVTGVLRNTYLDVELPGEAMSSRRRMMVVEVDAQFTAQLAAPVDFILGYTPSGFSERISPTAVTVYDANGAWELGLLYMEGSSVRLAVKTLDLTSGGAVRFAGAMPYPARSDPAE